MSPLVHVTVRLPGYEDRVGRIVFEETINVPDEIPGINSVRERIEDILSGVFSRQYATRALTIEVEEVEGTYFYEGIGKIVKAVEESYMKP